MGGKSLPEEARTAEPPRNASKTALGVAMTRAYHQLIDGEPKILDDPVAALLFGDELRRLLASRADQPPDAGLAGLRAHVVLRSRFTEDRLAVAVGERGVAQYVILGAGFDSFAFRQPDWTKGLHIFEVDHPGTQAEKRRRLAQAGLARPANHSFVAIDFETVSLRDGLAQSGLDFARPTFFSCLGVMIYLSREAVDAIFALVAGFPAGSEIAFTYSTRDRAFSRLAERVSAMGEPFQTHFDPDELRRDLVRLGYAEPVFLGLEEADRLFFENRADGLRPPLRAGIAAAVVGAAASG
jgi:methyltransferase (TIGR00027 family)